MISRRKFLCKRNQTLWIVFISNFDVRSFLAALAGVHNTIVWRRAFHRQRLHHAATQFRPITRLNVYVFAPEAVRAMVGVAVADHLLFAMLAEEVFDMTLKLFGGHCLETVP